jgi:hypothetical protein
MHSPILLYRFDCVATQWFWTLTIQLNPASTIREDVRNERATSVTPG